MEQNSAATSAPACVELKLTESAYPTRFLFGYHLYFIIFFRQDGDLLYLQNLHLLLPTGR